MTANRRKQVYVSDDAHHLIAVEAAKAKLPKGKFVEKVVQEHAGKVAPGAAGSGSGKVARRD